MGHQHCQPILLNNSNPQMARCIC